MVKVSKALWLMIWSFDEPNRSPVAFPVAAPASPPELACVAELLQGVSVVLLSSGSRLWKRLRAHGV